MVLGGGSSVLMHRDWSGRMLHMNIRGIQKIADDGDAVEVVVGAGESWHWVMQALDAGWNGLDLTLIPGSVGASPMQNIGAYGVKSRIDLRGWKPFTVKLGPWSVSMQNGAPLATATACSNKLKKRSGSLYGWHSNCSDRPP